MASHNLMQLLQDSKHKSSVMITDDILNKGSCKDFSVIVKSERQLAEIVERKKDLYLDTSAVIVISGLMETLMSLRDGGLAEVSITYNVQHYSNNIGRTAIVIFDENVPDNSVYISQALLFNMARSDLERYQISDFSQNLHYKLRIKKVFAHFEHLEIASKVILSPVNSPCYDSNYEFGYLMNLYFSQPRLIQEGDVLALNIEDDPRHLTILHGERRIRNPTIYFQVKQIYPSRGQVVNSYETLIQQEKGINSFIFHPGHHQSCYTNLEFIETWGTAAKKLFRTLKSHVELWDARQQMPPFYFFTNSSEAGLYFLVEAMAHVLFLHYYPVCCETFVGLSSTQFQNKLKHIFSMAQDFSPCLVFFENIEYFCKDQEGHKDARAMSSFTTHLSNLVVSDSKWPIIVLASSQNPRHVPLDIQKNFLQSFNIQSSHYGFRSKMLDLLIGGKGYTQDFVEKIARQTGGMDFNHLLMLSTLSNQIMLEGNSSSPETDVEAALKLLQDTKDCGTVPKIPHVKWDDIGGLEHVKQEIMNTISLPLKKPHLQTGLKRSGILLFGPPGTGKTLIAKAVATECSLNFLSIKGPELLNMYVGQSEENIREVFIKARSSSPCIVFFDELDSLVPNRGRMGDSGGVMDRVVSQFLAELDGMNKSNDVYVIGTTNRPDLIDPALLRPGRFDKLIYLGVDTSLDFKLKILKAITKRFSLGEVSLKNIAEACPLNMTGADFYVLCFDALLCATRRLIESNLTCDSSQKINDVLVREEEFFEVLRTFVPSLTLDELQNYNKLGESFSSCTV